MARKSPYESLGVDAKASDAEIKKAYRRLARKFHPDVNPGDSSAQKKFQEIASAYEILKDPERRRRFDLTGETGSAPQGSEGEPFGGAHGRPGGGFEWSGDLGDLFSQVFSRSGAGGPFSPFGAPAADEDDDAVVGLTVSFRDAVLGGTVSFRAQVPKRCGRCGGTGRLARQVCSACRGSGSVIENEKLSVRIPAGVDTGSKVRLAGKGRSESGDLYLVLTVEMHPYFKRDGDDTAADVPVSIAEAYLGAEIDVPTIHGIVRARIPAGTQTGQRFRLKAKGVENVRTGTTGDHYYRVLLTLPTSQTEEGRKLIERFEALHHMDVRAGLPKAV